MARFTKAQCAIMRRGIEVLSGRTTGFFRPEGSGEHAAARALDKRRHLNCGSGGRTYRVNQRGARAFMDFLEASRPTTGEAE